ncbi:MAG TPA: archease [Anaerolineae bacterium]|nr:archease [Anaerolineae bacterium]HOR00940.1 archease [Anaerolineae bacterium]HPL29861.1 archease [Anaerolineae bacterium]
MDSGYREVPHTADVALEVWAPDLAGLFAQAARGLFSLAANVPSQAPISASREVQLSAPDWEALLVDWLNELLSLADEHAEVYVDFEVALPALGELVAHARATTAYTPKIAFKAATYHNLAIRHDERGYRTVVVFDV